MTDHEEFEKWVISGSHNSRTLRMFHGEYYSNYTRIRFEAWKAAKAAQAATILQLQESNAKLRKALETVVHELQQWTLTESEPESVEALRIAYEALGKDE